MTQVEIRCPSCEKRGNFEIPDDSMKGVARGLLAVSIPSLTLCEHTFIAYVDRSFEIRDYFMADFKVELPQTKLSHEEKMKAERVPSRDIMDVDLIKLNLHPMLISHVLKSIFSKKKVAIISDLEFLNKHIKNFVSYITKDSFDADISIITIEEYKSKKKQYKDVMVLSREVIIRNVDKTIDPKKLKVEKQIVHNFISEPELGYSYIGLKNDIQKAFEICKEIMGLIKDYRESAGKEKVGKKRLINLMEEKTSIKLSIPYMEFLLDIIKNYFEFDLSIISDFIFPALGI